ncbi:MAG: OmpA family protein [Pararhodobacter sp.]
MMTPQPANHTDTHMTSLALAVPVTFPATMPARAQSDSGEAAICVEGSNDAACVDADDDADANPNREARREARREDRREERREERQEARSEEREEAGSEDQAPAEQVEAPRAEPQQSAEPAQQPAAEPATGRDQSSATPSEQTLVPAPATGRDQSSAEPVEAPRQEPVEQAVRPANEGQANEGQANEGQGSVTSAEDLAERLRGGSGATEASDQPEGEARREARREARQEARSEGQSADEAPAQQAETEVLEEGTPLTAEQLREAQEAEERQAEARRERRLLRQEAEASGAFVEETQSAAGDGVSEAPSDAALEAATGAAVESLAATGGGDFVEEQTQTVTEQNVRRSSDGFADAETRRQDRRERREDTRAGDDDNNDVRNLLAGVIVGAAGAMIVGSLLRDDREVVSTAPDRVVVRDQYGNLQVLRDDDATLRQPGSEVRTRRYADGSSETFVLQDDGTQVVTVRDAQARVVRRVHIGRDGLQTVLFDDTRQYEPVVVSQLPPPNRTQIPQVDYRDQQALRQALMTQSSVDRSFSLNQIRQIDRVRYLAPAVQVENITFPSGSAAVSASEAQGLLSLGQLMASMIQDNPNEVFLIEGHTDAVGSAVMNLTLSDRRAESVARALTEYFGVPAANMVLQGYGETDLRVATEAAERANRRVVVRRLTPLLQVAQAN